MCIHVNDILLAGTRSFHTSVVAHFKRKVLIGSSSESCSFKYLGINIVQTVDGIGLHQKEYVDAISEITLSCEHASRRMDNLQKEEMADYRSLIGQLNWLGTQTRPDIAFDVCDLSANLKLPSVEGVLKANRTIKKLKKQRVTLSFGAMRCMEQLTVECYSDASFGNLAGGGSQGGYIIFLSDPDGSRCLLSWQSRKVRRVVKSTLAAETLALLDAAEAGVYLANLITEVMCLECPPLVKCYVDNKSLVENLYSTKLVEDKQLRINIAVIRDMLERRDLSEVCWVQSARQIAIVLTKRGASAELLLSAVSGH